MESQIESEVTEAVTQAMNQQPEETTAETTTSTDMSVVVSYISDFSRKYDEATVTTTTLLGFLLVAVCSIAGLFMARSFRR